MTEHEKLVRDGAAIVRLINFNKPHWDEECARAVIALIAERLKDPTEEMVVAADAALDQPSPSKWDTIPFDLWRAMLAASPLMPPKGSADD